jgi:diguanylate cyclase (GGDEF)-like protein/PAS domain S-box-containing protein
MVKYKPKAKSGEPLENSLKMAAKKDKAEDRNHREALLRQQTAVARLGQLALASTNLSTLLKQATVLVSQTLEVEFARVWEYTENGKTMRLRGGIDWQQEMMQRIAVANGEKSERKESINKRENSWLEKQLVLEEDGVASSTSAVIQRVKIDKMGEGHDLILDKERNGKVDGGESRLVSLWGILTAQTTKKRTFTKDEINFLQAIANMLSQAIARDGADEKLRLLASAVEHAEDSILITKTNMERPGPEIVFVNSAFTRMTGYTVEEALGQTPRILQGAKTDRTVLERLRENLSRGEVFYGEAINYRKDGTEFYNEWHIEPIRDDGDVVTHYLAIQRDATERKEAEKQLYYKAFHDSLTGLPNRAMFMKRLGEAIAEVKETEKFAVLFLDLDCFKAINDSLGHLAGDRLLVALAHRLEACLRQTDTVARLGGDEFGILLKEVSSSKELLTVAERLQKEVRKPLVIDGTEIFPTTSIGIVFGGDRDGETIARCQPSELLRDADIAMYRAKARGKANAVVFERSMHEEAMARLQLENDLRRALALNELRLHYQPIVNLATNQIIGFEALVRWLHPKRGIVSPLKFIPLAEETGLIVPLGWWVLQNACRQLREWQKMFPERENLTMNVNLSGKQFVQKDLSERLEQVLVETGIKQKSRAMDGSLKLEITESTIVENEDVTISMLRDFQELGIKLAIDDFGTGYSSLSRLYLFPINTLKIDRSFINLMGEGGEKNEIVQTIISLAHGLGKDIVAEGVETLAQLATLQELQCEYGQGYFFSKPVDEKAAAALLSC